MWRREPPMREAAIMPVETKTLFLRAPPTISVRKAATTERTAPAPSFLQSGFDPSKSFDRRGSIWTRRFPHIGGTTPFLPIVIEAAVKLPSACFCVVTKTGVPGLMSDLSAGPSVTIGVSEPTVIFRSPPL